MVNVTDKYTRDCYWLFVIDEMIQLMVQETNRYIEQFIRSMEVKMFSRVELWQEVNFRELENL